MKKSTLSTIFRLPAEILLFASLVASIYVKFSGNLKVSWGAIVLLLIINVLYFFGRFMPSKSSFDF